jgi:serine protease AprX
MRSRVLSLALLLVLVLAAAPPLSGTGVANTPQFRPGLSQLQALGLAVDEPVVAIATHAAPATPDITAGLEALGLKVQSLKNIPVSLLYGPFGALLDAADLPGVVDVYPNEEAEFHSRESNAAISANVAHDLGFDGEGVGIAIVDSGVDCTHADLENRCIANYKMHSYEYLGLVTPSPIPNVNEVFPEAEQFVVATPVHEGPYNNSDEGGHGTHVAGIAAADGSNDPELTGVAPGANIIGYGTGDVLFIFVILGAFEHILENHVDDVDVVNNSWGSRFRTFDPGHPTNLGTKALHDAGIVVVQSAGNSDEEMTIGPWSVPPWVISSASTTIAAQRSAFSSSGLMYDNALPVGVDENGHVRFEGDRLGIYMPDVAAPGSNIVSTATPTGAFPGPGTQDGKVSASGTSMSAPHHSGLAALIIQAARTAGHDLTPGQVKQVMQVTAGPMADASQPWRTGFGFVDAARAVEFVTDPNFSVSLLNTLHKQEVQRILADRDYSVAVSDHWYFEALLPTTAGGAETRSFEFEVEEGIDAFRASSAFNSAVGLVGINEFIWDLEIRDADGQLLATSTTSGSNGLSILEVDLTRTQSEDDPDDLMPGLPEDVEEVAFGTWTLDVIGTLAVNNAPLLYAPHVSVAAVQLLGQERPDVIEPIFQPTGEFGLFLDPTDSGAGAVTPEGCEVDQVPITGGLAPDLADECRAAVGGYTTSINLDPYAFVSGPTSEEILVGGTAELVLHVADDLQPVWDPVPPLVPRILYTIDAVGPDDESIAITGGEVNLISGLDPVRGVYEIDVPPTLLPEGSQLRLFMEITGVYTSEMRLLYGGDFDSQIRFVTGVMVDPAAETAPDDDPPAAADTQLPATGGGIGLLGVMLALAAGVLVQRHTLARR